MASASLKNPSLYLNRELSWLAFNRRVLEEAEDAANPLLERVKYLAITASNLDEFWEVRIAALLQRIEDGYDEPGPDGLTPAKERDRIAEQVREFVDTQYRCWNERLLPLLAKSGIRVLGLDELDARGRAFVDDYSRRELDSLLTPVTVDPAHPFPRVINKALCMAFELRRRRRSSTSYLGVVTVPRALPRLIRVPSDSATIDFVFLADVVAAHATNMYRGYDIISAASFRVTRNSNLYVQEEESRNLLEAVRTELHNRRKGDAVRLEIDADASPEIVERLRAKFELEDWQVFPTTGPVNLSRLFNIYEQTDRPDLKFKTFVPRELHLSAKNRDLFEELGQHDVMLHHPFDSYNAVVSFIESAARDPHVLSIKQTLYRTNENSPIVEALVAAANSKEVTAVVELKARFDEASNIRWARDLEDAGVQVFHGLVGLKTHCKATLVVRRESDGTIRRYAHLGTGNYNPSTARLYTDLSLMTADPAMTQAVHSVFNFLTAYAERGDYDGLLVAPLDLAEGTLRLIDRETEHAKAGKPARLIAKMNSLVDTGVIRALYRASQAGVEIDLIVRGVCALRPGVRGVSDNIRVLSIVGRFLEHSRIFYFANAGQEEYFLGSADWMPRNLYERVELMFPVRDPQLRQRLRQEILDPYLADTEKARRLRADGTYHRPGRGPRRAGSRRAAASFNAQTFLIGMAEGKNVFEEGLTPHRAKPIVEAV
ncbi:MAG: polyphosphate kinase 1 [Acidobacteriota bacterium]|nr:polyphosphate kinase 1 [Acidobacteriota bacterium]